MADAEKHSAAFAETEHVGGIPKAIVVASVGLAEALEKAQPSPWTRRMFKLYFFLFIAFLNSCINGYDGSLMSGINVMSQYQKFFGMKEVGSSTGIVFSIYTIGNIVGSFFCGPFTDWWGRRWGMFIGAMIIVIGTCIQAPSINQSMFIGGRFILGFGVATCATAGPSYVAEMAHPAWRGTITGLYNTFWFMGGIPASFVLYGCNNLTTNLQWRLPVWLQAVASGGVILGCFFCPESPRWLISNDRHEEALKVMTEFYGEGDRESPIVQLSYKQMCAEIATEGSDKRWWDYRDLFNSKNSWWRMVCVIGMAFFGQWAGNGAISYFMPFLLKQVGITDTGTQLLYNAILSVISWVMATIGARFTDRLGRRPVLLCATALFVVEWSIVTALTSTYGGEGNDNRHGSRAAIAFIYLFGITYSFAYTPLQALYPVECLPFETRAKGMGMYNLFVNIAAFFNTFAIPIALERVSWKVYFLYIAWDCFQFCFIYLFFVETKGRTLEEINEIFDAPYPKKKSLEKHTLVQTEDGLREKSPSL